MNPHLQILISLLRRSTDVRFTIPSILFDTSVGGEMGKEVRQAVSELETNPDVHIFRIPNPDNESVDVYVIKRKVDVGG